MNSSGIQRSFVEPSSAGKAKQGKSAAIVSRPIRAAKRKLEVSDGEKNDQKKVKKKKPKRFPCTKCGANKKIFTTKKRLDNHIIKAHEKNSSSGIVCEICSAVLKTELFFKRHMKAKHPETPKVYICDFDGRTFTMKDYIRIHMDRHRRHQILTCLICQKSYISKHTFRRHLRIHIEKHICSQCGLVFSHRNMLENHYASKHSDDLPFKCDFCTRMFPSKSSKNNHHYIAHKNSTNELHFKCNKCNIFFEMKEELRIHSFIHFDGDIHTCLECHQIFKTNRLLQIHMYKHETKKSFRCETCGDSFTFRTGRDKHIRLNRCKGPRALDASQHDVKPEAIIKIATEQLEEITKKSKKFLVKPEINVMKGLKEKSDSESESDTEDELQLPTASQEEKMLKEDLTAKLETKEVVETKQTRKLRKRIPIIQMSSLRVGRPHLIYTCDYCGEHIKFKTSFIQHLKQHTLFQRYKCQQCDSTYKSRAKLLDHSIETHSIKPSVVKGTYSCEFCDKKFDIKSVLQSHKLSHDDTARSFICEVCNASFKTIGNLNRHQQTHVPTRDYHCEECFKSFKTQLSLKIHKDTVHVKYKIFVECPTCKAIVQEKLLKNHIQRKHTEEGKEKLFSCSVCHKTFRTAKLEERHFESVHEPKNLGKIYECPSCPGLHFNRQRDLKEHSFIHYDGVIFQCDICLKLFKTKRLLRIHSEGHNETPRDFPCKVCPGVVFKSRGGRHKHMLKNHFSQDIEAAAVKENSDKEDTSML